MPTRIDTLVTADYILTQNPQREIIRRGAIAVHKGRIVFLGAQEDMPPLRADRSYYLGNMLVMPGLINSHTHAAMTFLRGLADDLPLMQWLQEHIFPVEQHLTKDIVYLGTQLGCAEMLRTGTTAFSDMYLFSQAVCRAAADTGLKVVAGEVLFAFPSPAYSSIEDAFERVEKQIQHWQYHPRVRVGVMPHAVYTTTEQILQQSCSLAERYNAPLHIHMAETQTEDQDCRRQHGLTPLAYLDRAGALGPRTVLAHGVTLTKQDIARVAEVEACIVHNPKSNLKLASGVAPVPDMLRQGAVVALGSDGAASNNCLNMFSEMNCCALIHKGVRQDPTILPAQTVLDMCTLSGAKALGWEELGKLVVGGPADFIALDLKQPNLQPMYNPVSHAVYAASGHEVCFTMVDGQLLYAHGAYMKLDYPELCKEAQKLAAWVYKAYKAK